jgi:3'-phosphoadenosine 5'-phosphosulfate sulfotransferase (PAPS reductase)/FAD synthetase
MKRVINFSGGKTSALMTILLKPTEDDIVLFTDTQREHPLTYKFIDDFEKNEGIKVTRISYDGGFDAYVRKVRFLPNQAMRICTSELKIKTAKRYLRSLGIQSFESYIGFRSDEERRVKEYKQFFKKVIPKFPLYDMGISKEDVNQYWLAKPYTLEIPSILGNCDLCFLKGKNAIISILQHYPELADKWIADEKEIGATYFKDISYEQMLDMAQRQLSLFDLDKQLPAYSCSCTTF